MISNLIIRKAKPKDAKIIADLVLLSSGGMVEFLLHDLIPRVSPLQMVEQKYAGEEMPFTYLCTWIAEINGKIVGILHAHSNDYNTLPDPDKDELIPYERLHYIVTPMFENPVKNSFYIQSIAVVSEFRGKGIGKKLLDFVKVAAKKERYDNITLHAWSDNQAAIKLYLREGYKIIRHIDIPRAPFMPHDGGMELMQCEVNDER